jgi:ATP-binding cassette, subfamily B (MDR/TAP), member 1
VGRTVLIITHIKEMMQCAENVAVLNKGNVMEEGTYEELLRREGGAPWSILRSEVVASRKEE